jgi:phospholipid/cholesterol/gamma-HCH transport system permease protein
MSAAADFSLVEDGGQRIVRMNGALTLAEVRDLPQRLRSVDGPVSAVDLSGAERVDTIGAWIVRSFAREHGAVIRGASPDAQRLMDEVDRADQPVRMRPETPPSFHRQCRRRVAPCSACLPFSAR